MNLVDIIRDKQSQGFNLQLFFKQSPGIYITQKSTIESVSDDFIYIKSDAVDEVEDIYNIKDFMRIRIIGKKGEDNDSSP